MASEKHPEETSFRAKLRQLLERMGRPYEAIKEFEALANLEPDEDQHRANLEKAWQKLAHPIQAARYKKEVKRKDEIEEKGRAKTSTTPASSPRATADRGSAVGVVPVSANDRQEKKVEAASTTLIKKHHDANCLSAYM